MKTITVVSGATRRVISWKLAGRDLNHYLWVNYDLKGLKYRIVKDARDGLASMSDGIKEIEYGVSVCNDPVELEKEDEAPYKDEPEYSTPWSRKAIAALDLINDDKYNKCTMVVEHDAPIVRAHHASKLTPGFWGKKGYQMEVNLRNRSDRYVQEDVSEYPGMSIQQGVK